MALPLVAVAAAGAKIRHYKRWLVIALLGIILAQQIGFGLQAAFAFCQHFWGFQTAEIQFVDDGQHKNFEEHRLYHRAFYHNVQAAFCIYAGFDEAAFELKHFHVIHKIAFDEAHGAQVIQLIGLEFQFAQHIQFFIQFRFDVDQRVGNFFQIATAKVVHAVGLRELVQYCLQHRKFV